MKNYIKEIEGEIFIVCTKTSVKLDIFLLSASVNIFLSTLSQIDVPNLLRYANNSEENQFKFSPFCLVSSLFFSKNMNELNVYAPI